MDNDGAQFRILNRLASSQEHHSSPWLSPRRRKTVILSALAITFALFLVFHDFLALGRPLQDHWNRPHPEQLGVGVSASFGHLTTRPSHTATSLPIPTVTETVTVYETVPAPVDPVVFALIMFSADSASEGALLLKSIIMYNSSPSHIHVICDQAAQEYLEGALSLVTRPTHNTRFYFYRVSRESMLKRIEREGSIWTDHSAGVFGLMKLFIHEILPDTVKKAIFLDTDAFFIADPTMLWKKFDDLRPETALALPSHSDQNEKEWNYASNICSCVMLLNLERLRAVRFMDSSVYRSDTSGQHPPALSPPAFEAVYGPPGASGHYEGVHLGDQGYFWAVVKHYPDISEHLGFEWEVSSCLMDMYYTGLGNDRTTEAEQIKSQVHLLDTPQWGEAVLPKLLHFNCLDGTPRFFEWEGWSDPTNSLTQRWGAAVSYHVGFKWIWLNRPSKERTGPTLEWETISDVRFADEKMAAAKTPTS